MNYDFKTERQLLDKLISYAETPDNDNIRFKEKIKKELLTCPEILYLLHNKEYENELFTEDGSLNEDGEWDKYFGDNIRDYLFFPEAQPKVKNFLCYQTSFKEIPLYNTVEKQMQIAFTIFCDCRDNVVSSIGEPRHDLIGAILLERFAWSNIFNTQCRVISDKESTTDSNYATRKIVFESTLPNSRVRTKNGLTGYVNVVR